MKRRSARFIIVAAVVGILAVPLGAYAGSVSLTFGSLPSAQGWSFLEDPWCPPGGCLEDHFFSVGGGTLSQNTLDDYGTWFAPYYQRMDGVDVSQPLTFSVTARVVGDSGISGNDFGFGISVMRDGYGYMLGLSTAEMEDSSGNHWANDATQFHDYLMVVSPTVGFDLYVDGNWKLFSAARYEAEWLAPDNQNRLAFGDLTRGRGAQAEVTAFEIANSVPEPGSSLLLFGIALAGLRAARKHLP